MRKEKCYDCVGVFEIADNERMLCFNCERYVNNGDPCWGIKIRNEKCKMCGQSSSICILDTEQTEPISQRKNMSASQSLFLSDENIKINEKDKSAFLLKLYRKAVNSTGTLSLKNTTLQLTLNVSAGINSFCFTVFDHSRDNRSFDIYSFWRKEIIEKEFLIVLKTIKADDFQKIIELAEQSLTRR